MQHKALLLENKKRISSLNKGERHSEEELYSDLSKIEIIDDIHFIEYTKNDK